MINNQTRICPKKIFNIYVVIVLFDLSEKTRFDSVNFAHFLYEYQHIGLKDLSWAHLNLHKAFIENHQHRFSVNVCGLINNSIFGHFIAGHFTVDYNRDHFQESLAEGSATNFAYTTNN